LEKARLWPRAWQFACREEQIPDVGDHLLYEIAGVSYVVARTAPDRIQAFRNACLHRGRQLKQFPGTCTEFRCPFHGFAWHLDGQLKHVPSPWEFPDLDRDSFSLPQCQVGTWAGFVFLNPDPNAEPLASYLDDLPEHFARFALQDRYIEAHVSKIVRSNWKVAQEAFLESWHVPSTHPQTLAYVGASVAQVDVYRNFARFITPSEVVGPVLTREPSPEAMLRATLDVREDEELDFPLQEGETARRAVIRVTRQKWRTLIGDAIDEWSDAEVIDNFVYTVFPNMMPWGGVHKVVYRFRPNGDDHRSCLMEVFMLAPFVGERPAPAAEHRLAPDQLWAEAAELRLIGKVLDQDNYNMERVQWGLESMPPGATVRLAASQEDNIRWMRSRLDELLAEEI
jgi:phenylpropionate dioxygenase-like ring-hydroxylating dioxygenase large terminal subunit